MESGDTVRIQTILSTLAKAGYKVIVFNLSGIVNSPKVVFYDYVIYVNFPRKFYKFVARILKWRGYHDLNTLIKLTHYVDELIVAIKLYNILKNVSEVVVFGSMSLISFMLRLLGLRNVRIVYDTFGNHAQTLYLKSRRSVRELFRYVLFLALHKLQLRSSNMVIYPCKIDADNASKMFRIANTFIVPNPSPICFDSVEEYLSLRKLRMDYSRQYFILTAGSKVDFNEEAVKLTIEVFNKLPPNKFKLYITGPWQDMKKYVKNPSIELVGIVTKEKLKELLAIADYGLAPIFSHATGTFIKVLSYISAGLDIIASPSSVAGLNSESLKRIKVYLVRNKQEYAKTITKIVYEDKAVETLKTRNIMICRDATINIVNVLKAILSHDTVHL
jgi:glycosyltransferase involved in cell wall biosynthesis